MRWWPPGVVRVLFVGDLDLIRRLPHDFFPSWRLYTVGNLLTLHPKHLIHFLWRIGPARIVHEDLLLAHKEGVRRLHRQVVHHLRVLVERDLLHDPRLPVLATNHGPNPQGTSRYKSHALHVEGMPRRRLDRLHIDGDGEVTRSVSMAALSPA